MFNDPHDPITDANVSDALAHLVGEMRDRSHPSLALEVLCLRLSRDALAQTLTTILADLQDSNAAYADGARTTATVLLEKIERDRERIALALTGSPV